MMQDIALCPDCAGRNRGENRYCWLCNRDLHGMPRVSAPQTQIAATERGPGNSGILVVLWFLAIALCAIVGAGVALINPWLLVPFAVVAIAPIVAAFIGSSPSATRPASGKPQSRAESFIVSAAVTIVIAVLVGVAGVVALFVQCVQAFGSAMI